MTARVDFLAGRVDREGLRAEEDRAILTALRHQRECGLDVLTDGEFRRASFVTEDGVAEGFAEAPYRHAPVVSGRLQPLGRIADVEASFMRDHAEGSFKITLPSPVCLRRPPSARTPAGEQACPAAS